MRTVLCALIWSGLVLCAGADPARVRLAVVSDAETQGFAALLVTELSHDPAVSMVERDDLARVGDERRLQQLAGSDAAALGKMVGADGLVFIGQGADGTAVRLTAVSLGHALFDDRLPASGEPPTLAQAMARRLGRYFPKLKLDPAQAIPISLLNLRADFATPTSTDLERRLTLLLESRLSALPDHVVLERRHGAPLGFERAAAASPPPLLPGAYIVDGTLSVPIQDLGSGDAVVQLRVRAPDGRQTRQEIRGPSNDLPGLVEKLAAAIQVATGKTAHVAAWKPEKEAREYLEEGIWGWRHGVPDAALEALDTAELLGEKATDLVAVRIDVLSARVRKYYGKVNNNPNDLKSVGTPAAVDGMIDDTLRALSEGARYEAGKMQASLQLLTWQQNPNVRTDQIKEDLTELTSDLLVFLDDRHLPRADELRAALRTITGYDPLHGKLGRADMSNPLYVMTWPDRHWDSTLAEELAYYHLLGTLPHQYISPELLTGHGKGFCRRFLADPEQQKAAYLQFLEDLKTDPAGRLTYLLIRACSADEGIADEAYTAYWREMWNRREGLVRQDVQIEEWTSARPIPEARRRKHTREMLPLLRYYLTHVNNYRYWEYFWETVWQPEQWSDDEAAAVWADYMGFRQRAMADRAARGHHPPTLAKIEESFGKRFPQIARADHPEPGSEPLVVSHLWHPWLLPGIKAAVPVMLYRHAVTADAIWLDTIFRGDGRGDSVLMKVSPPTFTGERVELPETMLLQHLAAGPRALYLAYTPLGRGHESRGYTLARYDLTTHAWAVRDAGIECNDCFVVGDSLYLNLLDGMARYDWDTGQLTLLASSRRKPAQNQFDDREHYFVASFFAGPGGQPCVTMEDGTFYVREQPGNWPEVFDSGRYARSVTGQKNTTLVCATDGEVVLLDPARTEPSYLLTPTQLVYRKAARMPDGPGRQLPPWAGQARWDAEANVDWAAGVGGSDQQLFKFKRSQGKTGSCELIWYDLAHGRNPRHIPLGFLLDQSARTTLAPIYDGSKSGEPTLDGLEQPGLKGNVEVFGTETGVCLLSNNVGIWFIPYHDITQYLENHAEAKPGVAASPAPPRKLPAREDDAESQVIGDMVDPAMRSTSFR